MSKFKLLVCALGVMSASAMAQTCKYDIIERTQPVGQYFDNKNGTVTDIVNGLIWTKCSVGENYNEADNGCAGDSLNIKSWKEALSVANDNESYLGQDGWRLPNIKELNSLIERACVAPSISLSSFPSTQSAVYWSNTFDAKNINPIPGVDGLVIDFTNGTEFVTDVNRHRLIRLVKDVKQ